MARLVYKSTGLNDESSTINPVEQKTVLVTGGAGYVGSLLVRRLLASHFGVVCIDNLRFGGGSLMDIWDHPAFKFVKVDITNHKETDEVLSSHKFYGIVHLASIVGDPACKREPDLATRTNREASLHLLEKAVKTGVERFVFASTCSNYGRMNDANGCLDETSPLNPVSLYAQLKVEFENVLLNEMVKSEEFSPTALRFSTVYGLSPRMRFDLTVNEFTKQLALGRELVVFGEFFWRPYCHVSDFSRAILTILQAPREKVAYNVFNVGDNSENYTKKMIVDELLKKIPDGQVKFVEKKEDPRDYRVNFDKIRNETGFQISKTVPAGIDSILRSIRMGIISDPDDQKYYNVPI